MVFLQAGAVHGTLLQQYEKQEDSLTESLIQYEQHEEPERPIHPAFEWEILAERDSVSGDAESVASRKRRRRTVMKVATCSSVVLSGAGHVVTAKLQATSLYNYPHFLNLFLNLLYIPIFFVYLGPMAKRYGSLKKESSTESLENVITGTGSGRITWKAYAIAGTLDGLTMTMQIFAAVYVPGTVWVVLPQTVWLLLLVLRRRRISLVLALGTMLLSAGILFTTWHVWRNRQGPEYACQAVLTEDDCLACQHAFTEDACTQREKQRPEVIDSDRGGDLDALCQWVPYEEATETDGDVLAFFGSLVLLVSTIPMAFSALYKQRLLSRTGNVLTLVWNGWMAVFTFLSAMVAALVMESTPSSHSLNEVWDGMLCFAGYNIQEKGCHPDTACETWHAAIQVHLHLVCHVAYAVSIMGTLKYAGPRSLSASLTAVVPISYFAFALPILPDPAVLHWCDFFGIVALVSGLFLLQFPEESVLEKVSCQRCHSVSQEEEPVDRNEQEEDKATPKHSNSLCVSPSLNGHEDLTTWLSDRNHMYNLLEGEPLVLTGDV